jgi:2-oxoglutarate dehydrogenase E1 component
MVFLLPHGYEGQGPEHSSARPERLLEAAADINLRLVNCTTAAQYFHLLRRQAALLERDPLPLFVLTPKSLLRHPSVASTPQQLADGRFMSVLDDEDARRRPKSIERVVLCSGKVYVDLISDDKRAPANSIAICRVEQLYPFPEIALKEILDRYASAREIVWLQEEPENMGAWPFYRVALEDLLDNRRPLHYIGRGRSSSPSEGSAGWHHVNQKALVAQALDPRSHSTEPSMVLSKQV